MAEIDFPINNILLQKNRKLFFISLLREKTIRSVTSNIYFSDQLNCFFGLLQEYSDNLFFVEQNINKTKNNKIKSEDEFNLVGKIYNYGDNFFGDNLKQQYFNQMLNINNGYQNGEVSPNTYTYNDQLSVYDNNKSEEQKINPIINFCESVNISKSTHSFDYNEVKDFGNYIKVPNYDNIIFKLKINDAILQQVNRFIYNNKIAKDLFLNYITDAEVKLLVYKENKLLKTYVLKPLDETILQIIKVQNYYSDTQFTIRFKSNFHVLQLKNYLHNGNVFEKHLLSFSPTTRLSHLPCDYKIISNRNCNVSSTLQPISDNASCIIRVYFSKTINIFDIKLLFSNNIKQQCYLQYRKSFSDKTISYMRFSDRLQGYCNVIDIKIKFKNSTQKTQLSAIQFFTFDPNKDNIYKNQFKEITQHELKYIDAENFRNETYDKSVFKTIQFKDVQVDSSQVFLGFSTNNIKQQAEIILHIDKTKINYYTIYVDSYKKAIEDNSYIFIDKFMMLGQYNKFSRYFSLDGLQYSYQGYFEEKDRYGNIISHKYKWKSSDDYYFYLSYVIVDNSYQIQVYQGKNKYGQRNVILSQSNNIYIEGDNIAIKYNQFEYNIKRVQSKDSKINIYYSKFPNKLDIPYNGLLDISEVNDVYVKITFNNSYKEKMFIRSIVVSQHAKQHYVLQLDNYINFNQFGLQNSNKSNKINDSYYMITNQFKSKYSSDFNTFIDNNNKILFDKTFDKNKHFTSQVNYRNVEQDNVSVNFKYNPKFKYIVLLDQFDENVYSKYLLPNNDINSYLNPLQIKQFNDYTQFKFQFDKVQLITNIILQSNHSMYNQKFFNVFYSISYQGNNWSEYKDIKFLNCVYARYIKVRMYTTNKQFDVPNCIISYLNSDKYILVDSGNFNSFIFKQLQNKKYIFRLIKYFNKSFYNSKVIFFDVNKNTTKNPQVYDIYIDNKKYIGQPLRVSSQDNIIDLKWKSDIDAQSYNIKIYIDGNLYYNIDNITTNKQDDYNCYTIIFDNNFKSKTITCEISYIYNNITSYKNTAEFKINNKPTTPVRMFIK